MKNEFKYSVLQYKHSQLLKEAVNVGLLFYFPAKQQFEFVIGNAQRIKTLYPNFSIDFFQSFIKYIKNRVALLNDHPQAVSENLDEFIHQNILPIDATVLQFTKADISVLTAHSIEVIVEEYADLFLPGRRIEQSNETSLEEQLLAVKS